MHRITQIKKSLRANACVCVGRSRPRVKPVIPRLSIPIPSEIRAPTLLHTRVYPYPIRGFFRSSHFKSSSRPLVRAEHSRRWSRSAIPPVASASRTMNGRSLASPLPAVVSGSASRAWGVRYLGPEWRWRRQTAAGHGYPATEPASQGA